MPDLMPISNSSDFVPLSFAFTFIIHPSLAKL